MIEKAQRGGRGGGRTHGAMKLLLASCSEAAEIEAMAHLNPGDMLRDFLLDMPVLRSEVSRLLHVF